MDQYKESDFGLGSEYKLTDKLTLDAGSWYYYYYSAGDHYFEPYTSLSYDWIVSPTIYFSMITYNNTPRAVLSFDYNKDITENLHFNFRPVVGTADYDNRYGYYGSVIRFDYDVNKFLGIFTVGEIDKPFSSPDNSIVENVTFESNEYWGENNNYKFIVKIGQVDNSTELPANSSVAYPIGTAITFINMAVETLRLPSRQIH